jgi:hypothetical protein
MNNFTRLVEPHFVALFRAAVRHTRHRQDAGFAPRGLLARVCQSRGTERRRQSARLAHEDPVPPFHRRGAAATPLAVCSMERRRRGLRERRAGAGTRERCKGAERVVKVWDRLDAEQRTLLALHAEGCGIDELTQVFGITKNALSARTRRLLGGAACRRRPPDRRVATRLGSRSARVQEQPVRGIRGLVGVRVAELR